MSSKYYMDRFSIKDELIIITGGGGLIGLKHAEAVLEGDGIPVLLDISASGMNLAKTKLEEKYEGAVVETFTVDIINRGKLEEVRDCLLRKYGHIDGLINNAANNPKVEGGEETLPLLSLQTFLLKFGKTTLLLD